MDVKYLIIMMICINSAIAIEFFVSSNGNNADGLSWSTAWDDLNQIEWGSISPGDTIYLDGGTESMSYGRIVSGAGGTSSNRILISRSEEQGHDGKVFFSGAEINHPYITIDGLDKNMLELYGSGGYNFRIQGASDSFELNNIYLWGDMKGSWGTLIYLTSGSLTINNSEIYGQSAKEDQIKFYSTGDLHIENSVFHGWRSIDGSHSDFLEGACNAGSQPSCPGGNVVVRNNIFYDAPHDCFMMSDTAFKNVEFTGNVFHDVSDAIKLYSAEQLKIHNNFFYSCRELVVYDTANKDCKNNIYSGINPWDGSVSKCTSTYSLWDVDSPGFISSEGNIQADPMFQNPGSILGPDGIVFTDDDGFRPESGSPVYGAGENGADIGPYSGSGSSNVHYVRDGANGDGSDWANAWGEFSDIDWSSINPGDTIEVAGGDYGGLTVSASGQSGNPIVIKRTENPLYSSLVTMTGINLGSSSHVTIDGSVDNGILVQKQSNGYIDGHYITDNDASFITLKNMELIGPGYIECDSARGMNIRADNLVVNNLDIHDFSTVAIRLIGNDNVMIKNSRFHNIGSKGDTACQAERGINVHYEHIAVFDGTNDVTIVNNLFSQDYNTGSLAGGFAVSMAGHNGYIRYINNVFFNMGYHIYLNSDGFGDLTEYTVIGNTFAGFRVPIGGSPHTVKNNIFCNIHTYFDPNSLRWAYKGGSHNLYCFDRQTYVNDYKNSDNSQVLPEGTIPFVDYLSDWHLTVASESGDSISYNTDIEGEVRGADGVWDRGAYEFSAGCVPMTTSDLISEIDEWKSGTKTIQQLMQSIKRWKDGC